MIAVVVPPLGIVLAMGLLWGIAFHWVDVVLFAALYVVCAFGTTIGFHRYFTHRGFEARAPVKAALAILGCMTMQGPVTQWVTDHRKHHALSDKPGDPHSPHVGHGDGAWGAMRGFVHAHVGWMFSNMGMEQGREYGRDLYEDRLIRTIDRMYLLWVVLTLGLPFAIGYAIGGTWQAGVEGLVWGGLIRECVMLAVVSDPLRQRPLHRHAAEDREQRLDRLRRLEAAMREVAVEADRRPERADDVEAGEEREVEPVERDAPEQSHRGDETDRRDDYGDQRDDLADPACPGADGSYFRGGFGHCG